MNRILPKMGYQRWWMTSVYKTLDRWWCSRYTSYAEDISLGSQVKLFEQFDRCILLENHKMPNDRFHISWYLGIENRPIKWVQIKYRICIKCIKMHQMHQNALNVSKSIKMHQMHQNASNCIKCIKIHQMHYEIHLCTKWIQNHVLLSKKPNTWLKSITYNISRQSYWQKLTTWQRYLPCSQSSLFVSMFGRRFSLDESGGKLLQSLAIGQYEQDFHCHYLLLEPVIHSVKHQYVIILCRYWVRYLKLCLELEKTRPINYNYNHQTVFLTCSPVRRTRLSTSLFAISSSDTSFNFIKWRYCIS